jgi:hypothetical protein
MRLVSKKFLKMMNEYMLKNCMINVCDMMYCGTSTYTFNVKNITKVRLSCLTSIEYESNKDILVEFLRSIKSANHIEVVYNFQNISILKYFDENTIDILRIHSDIIPKSSNLKNNIDVCPNIKKIVLVYHQDFADYNEIRHGNIVRDIEKYITSKNVEFEFQISDNCLDVFI